MESSPVYGLRCRGLLASYDRESQSWKMSQQSLFEDLTESYIAWPRWGMMQNGQIYPLKPSAHHISVTGGSLLPTPTASERQSIKRRMRAIKYGKEKKGLYTRHNQNGSARTYTILDSIAYWEHYTEATEKTIGIKSKIHPRFVTWIMGFPIEWLD